MARSPDMLVVRRDELQHANRHDETPSGVRYHISGGAGEPQLVHVLEVGADDATGRRVRAQVGQLVRLAHPHVLTLSRVASTDDGHLVVIGSVPAQDALPLRTWALREEPPLRRILHLLRQLAETLDELHAEELVHGALGAPGAVCRGSWRGREDFLHIDWAWALAWRGATAPDAADDVTAVVELALALLTRLDGAPGVGPLAERLQELRAEARADELLGLIEAAEQAALDGEPAVRTTWTLDMVEADPHGVPPVDSIERPAVIANPKGSTYTGPYWKGDDPLMRRVWGFRDAPMTVRGLAAGCLASTMVASVAAAIICLVCFVIYLAVAAIFF